MDDLDKLLAESAPKASGQQVQAPSQQGDELDKLLAESAPNKSGVSGQLPSFTQYANKVVDDNKGMIQDMVSAKGPSYAMQSMRDEPKQDLSALTSLGTGVLQGGADVGYGVSQVPAALVNSAAWMSRSPYRMDYGVKPVANATQYQQQAVAQNPVAYYGGEAIGNTAMLAPGLAGATTAPQILGRSGMLGAAAYPSSNPGEKLAAGVLGMAATAVPLGLEKGAQGLVKGITGTEIDPSVAAAAQDVGMDKLPHVLLTKNDNLKNELTNSVLPGTGNEAHRQLARANKDQFDQKANEFIGGFNVTTPEGLPLVGENGSAPTQAQVKKNVDRKVNDTFSGNKDRVARKYLDMDNEAANTGAIVSVNNYADKLRSIIDWEPGVGQGKRPPDAVISFAKDELSGLEKQGALSKGAKAFKLDADGNKVPVVKEGKGTNFSDATDIKEKLNQSIGDSNDREEKRHLIDLKHSLMSDINSSVEKSGNEKLMGMWKDAESDYASSVAPFREHKGLSRHLNEKKNKASPDDILGSLVKGDNPTDISQAVSLVPSIKDDLGFLKLREAGGKFNKKNNPDINNALTSIGNMSDDAGVALFGPDKWKKLDSFKTLHGAIKPYLEFGANPNTGARVQQAEAKQMAGDAAQAFAAITAATGHPVGAAAGLIGKGANKIGLNKMKASLMANPRAFESANAQSMLTPAARKAYQSLMVSGAGELVNQANKQGE